MQQTNDFLSECVNMWVSFFLITKCTKASNTDFIFVRFFTSMSQVMCFNVSTIVGTFPTFVTLIRFFLCTSKCSFKFELSVNPLPQHVQQKGFSPVSVSKCLRKSPRSMYPLPYAMHTCGFSPVCESPCFFDSLIVTNPFTQCRHICGTSPVCIMLWTLILPAWLQPMPLTAHTYCLLSPLQIIQPTLSDTVPDTVCTWSLLTPGPALFPVTKDWQTKCSQLWLKSIPHYSATTKKIQQPCYKTINN